MTLSATGQLLVNSTSTPNSGEVRQLIAASAGGSAFLQFQNTSSATGCTIGTSGENFIIFTNTNTIGGGGGAYTERARIDSAGRFGIGVTPIATGANGTLLQIGNAASTVGSGLTIGSTTTADIQFSDATSGTGQYAGLLRYSHTDNSMQFWTSSAERARIDSSGNLLVGNTDNAGVSKTNIYQSADSTGLIVRNANASNTAAVLGLSADRNTTNNSYYFIRCDAVGVAYRFQVADSGDVTNTNNSYGAISDAKLKENVTDATPKLDKLNQVRVVNFNIIGSEQKQLGVIAQELEQVFPGMVDEAPDRDAEGNDLGTTTKSVKYSVFVPMLIKAMQEQQAIINSLKARLDAANL
jgi:hypothetical protein